MNGMRLNNSISWGRAGQGAFETGKHLSRKAAKAAKRMECIVLALRFAPLRDRFLMERRCWGAGAYAIRL